MLETLSIKNFAIIEDIEVNFRHGMNVLLGETGAGKSIIIDAIALLKGERSSFEMIRSNATKAYIEGRFILENAELINYLNKTYDNIIEKDELIVTRTLDISGRTSIKMNGMMFSSAITKSVMNEIIDIHSQHQNLMILDEKNHLELLDKYIANDDLLVAYQGQYKEYVTARKELEHLKNQVIDEEAERMIKEKLAEIENMNIRDGELNELQVMSNKMSNFVKLQNSFSMVDALLDGENGAMSNIYQAKKELEHLQDDEYQSFIKELSNSFYSISEVNSSLKSILTELNDYEYSSDYLNERIYNIKKIIRKYGETEADVLIAKEKFEKDLMLASDFDYYVAKQTKIVEDLESKLLATGHKLSDLRKEKAIELASLVDKELESLSLQNAHFNVGISAVPFKDNGIDEIRFLVSTNVGTPFASLKAVISGGEASRLMLGLKAIFTKFSPVETVIFDEIDVGVSGKVAAQVGNKIHTLSKDRQVIVISHLAQVAAFGDYSFEVRKVVENGHTKTMIEELTDEGFKRQIASILSNGDISDTTLKLAEEMISKANNMK